MAPRIELNTAATSTRHPKGVGEAMLRALADFGNGGRGVDDASLAAARGVEAVRRQVVRFFHLDRPERVIFTSNATQALNIALFGLLSAGDEVITTQLEHNSVLRPLHALMARGVTTRFLPTDGLGNPVYDALEDLATPQTRMVVMTAMSNLTGNVTDLSRVGRFCREHDLLFVVDGAQAAGSMPLFMDELPIDVLCFTGHKGLMGPQGTGGLLIRKGVEVSPLLFGGTGVDSKNPSQPSAYPARLEAGTLNGVGLAGLGAGIAALEEIGLAAVQQKETALLHRFLEGIAALPYRLYGDFRGAHGPIVSLTHPDMDAAMLSMILSQEYGIATRAGMHCAPEMHHALDTEDTGAVRFSWNWFTEETEIDAALAALREIAEE